MRTFILTIWGVIASRTFIQVMSLAVTLESAIFLAKGNLGLSAEVIAQLSTTKWNYNPDVVKSLAQQRAETWIGVVLLLVAFTLQMCNELRPEREEGVAVQKRTAIFASVIFSIALFFAVWAVASWYATRTERSVRRILEAPAKQQ